MLAAADCAPSLIMLDLNMPRIGGFTFLQRYQPRDTPSWCSAFHRWKRIRSLHWNVVDPIFWTEKRLFLRWWAALKIEECQCLKPARVTHPA